MGQKTITFRYRNVKKLDLVMVSHSTDVNDQILILVVTMMLTCKQIDALAVVVIQLYLTSEILNPMLLISLELMLCLSSPELRLKIMPCHSLKHKIFLFRKEKLFKLEMEFATRPIYTTPIYEKMF